MYELRDMLKRVKLDKLMSYFIYDTDSNGGAIENYERVLDESYDNLFRDLQNLYPVINRDDEKLLEIVMRFTGIHEDTYFEMGVLTGFQLLKNLEQGYERCEQNNMHDILQKFAILYVDAQNEEKKAFLERLSENRIDTALEESLKQNCEYQYRMKAAYSKIKKIENMGFDCEQWKVIDSALSASNQMSAEYGKNAYNQGFKDAIKLLVEIYAQ